LRPHSGHQKALRFSRDGRRSDSGPLFPCRRLRRLPEPEWLEMRRRLRGRGGGQTVLWRLR
jgi:hypothetical protein